MYQGRRETNSNNKLNQIHYVKLILKFLGPLGPLVVALSVSLSVILIAQILNYTVNPNIKSSRALQHHSTAGP